MRITDSKKVKDIQNEFSELYPGLRLEFYEHGHRTYKASPEKSLISRDVKINSIRTIHNEGEIELVPEMTVKEVEDKMKNVFGLNVQVFRRSKAMWMQTSTTDDWTLDKQNLKALNSINPNVKLYDRL